MEGTQKLNLATFPARGDDDAPRKEKDLAQLREAINQAGFDIRRAKLELDRQQDMQESHHRRIKTLGIALAILIVLFVGASWLAFPVVNERSKFAGDMIGLQGASSTLGQRINAVEQNLGAAMAALPNVSNRMGQLEANMKSALQTAGNQAQAAATRAGQRIREDVTKTMQMIQSRLAGVESNQREASERTNELQKEIAGLQQQIASMREESSAATEKITQLEEAQQARAQILSSLDRRTASNQAALDTLANRRDMKRIDFDIEPWRTQEVASGIYMTVSRADLKKQEIDGRMQLAKESRMLPIRAQGIQKPVLFYVSGENRPMELVITQVAKNRVSGYVLMPIPVATAANVDNSGR